MAEKSKEYDDELDSLAALSSTMAHDFNNVLCTILGQAELLESKGQLDRKQVQRLQSIRMAAHRGVELTRKFGAFGLRRKALVQPLVAKDVLADLLEVFSCSLGPAKGLRIEIEEDCSVLAEKTALLQVVSELLANAREFSGPAGDIRLSVQSVGKGEVCLLVEDQGPGFPSDIESDRLFEAFVSTGSVGRGIGLSAVDAVMRAHGGRVECSSDGGARVACFFPGQEPVLDETESARNVSVWVLED